MEVVTNGLSLGHWIQMCPTNNDPNFDGRPRVKRTTGIPRSFLKTIEKPAALSNDGTLDDTKQPSGVMVNAEGEFVIAEPDRASWEQYQAKAKVSAAAQQAAATGSEELREKGLECSIDKRIFLEPTRTPCCGKTYCNDCIINALIENDLVCPGCSTEGVLIDNLVPDEKTAAEIKAFQEEKASTGTSKNKPENSLEGEPVTSTSKSADTKSASPSSQKGASTATSGTESIGNTRKRRAEEELSGQRTPPAPGLMRNQHPIVQQQLQQTMNGFNPLQMDPLPNLTSATPFPQMPLMNGNPMTTAGMTPMAYPSSNGYMSMAANMAPLMGTNTGLMNGMILPVNGYIGNNGNAWNNVNAAGFTQPLNGMYGPSYSNGMMPNSGYGAGAMQFPMGNMSMGMTSMITQPQGVLSTGKGHGAFLNQQRTIFSEPFPNEENDAYFRKPVNPHRHQARQRRVRPSDYREL